LFFYQALWREYTTQTTERENKNVDCRKEGWCSGDARSKFQPRITDLAYWALLFSSCSVYSCIHTHTSCYILSLSSLHTQRERVSFLFLTGWKGESWRGVESWRGMWVQHTYSKRGRNTRTQEKERRRWQRRRIFWERVLKKCLVTTSQRRRRFDELVVSLYRQQLHSIFSSVFS
jgi:hypothetical protein